jgi:membrane associated rhomboid family serine protease
VKANRPSQAQQIRANFRQPMFVTQVLLASFAAMFVLPVLQGDSSGLMGGSVTWVHENFALTRQGIAAGEWWRLLTCGFLHFGVIHLLFNGWAMWSVGQSLERGLGRWRFIALFVVSVLGGSAGALVLSNPNAITAGASGGLFGFFAAGYMGSRARGISFGASGWGPTLLMNLFITFSIPGISLGGHLGGAVAGGICGAVLLGRPSLISSKASRDQKDIMVLAAVGIVSVLISFVVAYS